MIGLARLEQLHRQHAVVEDRIRCGKQTGLQNLPFRGFQPNAAWLELALIAQDLLAWTQRLLLEGELARCSRVKESCAPGCGRSRRQIARVPAGQRERSSESSAAAAPSRGSPAWVSAGRHACSETASTASRTGSVRSKPTEKPSPRPTTKSASSGPSRNRHGRSSGVGEKPAR